MEMQKPRGLTPARMEVLRAAWEMESSNAKRIAKVLGKSPETVRRQFQEVLTLLEVHERMAAVMLAHRSGWIQPPCSEETSET